MGFGKILLIGFGGLMALSGVAAMFAPSDLMGPPEEREILGAKAYFRDSCAKVTRNRYIEGKLGQGPAYCACIQESLDGRLKSRDEYRYVADLQAGIGKERIVFAEERIAASVSRTRDDYMPLLGAARMKRINDIFFPKAKRCTEQL